MQKLITLFLVAIGITVVAQPAFDDFGKQFKTAVAKNDMAAIADMMEFPFSSFDWGSYVAPQNSQIETRADFLKFTKKIFTKKVIQQIAKSEFKKIEDEDEGTFYYTLVFWRSDEGAAWIIFNIVDGKWKAIGTDNVSM